MTISVIVDEEVYGAVPFRPLPFLLLLLKPPIKRCTCSIFSLVKDLRISTFAYPTFNIKEGLYVHFSIKLTVGTGCTSGVPNFFQRDMPCLTP